MLPNHLRPIFLLMALLWANFVAATQVSIVGKIDQATETEVHFSIIQDELSRENLVYRVTLKPDNSFGISMDIGDKQWFKLRHGKAEFDIFVTKDGARIDLSFDATQPLSSLRFHGPNALNNTVLTNFQRVYQNHGIPPIKYEAGGLLTLLDGEIVQKAKSYADYDYFDYLDRQFRSQQQYVHSQANISSELFRYMDKCIGWRYEVNKITYFLMNKDRLSRDDLQGYWRRYSLLQYADIHDDASLPFPEYQNLLTAFIHYLDLESPGDVSTKDLAFYRFVKGNLSGKTGFFMMAKLILDNYQRDSNPRLVHQQFKRFKRDNIYPEYTRILENLFGPNLEYVPQVVVPDFKMSGQNGELIFLGDFAGRVVYISFWASWCGPCLSGFRQTNQIRKQLLQDGVVLLNVNLDDTETAWKNTLLKEDIPGVNVFAGDWNALKEKLNFTTLPHYLLVDKSGLQTYLTTSDLNAARGEFYELNLK